MLQRAASNAYSWWWASHIRTKQSRWLEQCMQDMEAKVDYVLKLISQDGDSFAKRAEMYYSRRPQLIEFVEEYYRSFRDLAERYDKLSRDLQNANTTIATCLPEQVQYSMDDYDDDDFDPPKPPKDFTPNPNIPKVPNAPNKALRGIINSAHKKLQTKKKPTYTQIKPKPPPKSGLTKTEAVEEVDKLQKDILALQTVKEFVKSSYENGLAKFQGIENEINEKQEKASRLEEEFGIGNVIEDNDARNLMAKAALKSCQETLAQLESKQDKSNEEAEAESKKLEEARRRLKSIKQELFPDETHDDETPDQNYDPQMLAGELQTIKQDEVGPEGQKLEALGDKIKEELEADSSGSITVTELAEKIDELVNKVINLENSLSSQTVLINRLRTEANDLNSHLRHLEDDKATPGDGTHNLSSRVKDLEDKLKGVQNLNQNVANHNINLRIHFSEAHSSLDQLSDKLQSVKADEDGEQSEEQHKGEGKDSAVSSTASKTEEKTGEIAQNQNVIPVKNKKDEGEESHGKPVKGDKTEKEGLSQTTDRPLEAEAPKEDKESDEDLNWPEMLLNGVEDKDKILMKEYTTILRNYKEAKKKLLNQEKKSDALFQATLQLRELKNAIAKRDQEIQSLRHKLNEKNEKNEQNENTGNTTDTKDSAENEKSREPPEEEVEEEIKFLINQPKAVSPVEENLRGQIDGILDENLDFWLRFSAAFHQVQKFKNEIKDLQEEISTFKTREAKKTDGKTNTSMFTTNEVNTDLKSDVRAVFKHLNEIKAELKVWLEQSESLKEEMQNRFSSLCNIQRAITAALKEGAEEEEITFSSHQAAKFQGEILNMKQENNKVNEELQAGIDHVKSLQAECEKTITSLDEEYGLTEKAALRSTNKPQIPLRSFIFGVKEKKKKQSILSYMHPARKSTAQ